MKERARHQAGQRVTCHDGHAIGLDIGATSIRAAVLAIKGREGEQIVSTQALAGVLTPDGAVVNGAVVDGRAITGALQALWRANDLKCRNVILGVASPQVLVRELQMPDLDAQQRARALPFQARDVIAMPLDQVILDFAPLGEPNVDDRLQNGLLVASPRQPILAAIGAVEAAGLTVVRVDLASFAVLRAAATGRFDVEAVIDMGAHLTTVVVHRHGVPRLVRTLPRGGEELTHELADRIGTGLREAEEAKCAHGLTSSDEVSSILRELVAPLIGEIRSSLNYFRTSQPGAPLERVTLTGRAASLSGLTQTLADQVGVPVDLARVADQLVLPVKSRAAAPDPSWATALSVGLAIGAAA
jgi:type IV pilus assembly protein PilM